jgi:hypothetical protein
VLQTLLGRGVAAVLALNLEETGGLAQTLSPNFDILSQMKG